MFKSGLKHVFMFFLDYWSAGVNISADSIKPIGHTVCRPDLPSVKMIFIIGEA